MTGLPIVGPVTLARGSPPEVHKVHIIMSFISVLKSIGHVVKTGVADIEPFAPVIAAIPVAGGPISAVIGAIGAVESLIPQPGSGAAKKQAVTTVVNAAAPGIDPTALSSAIDQIVAAFNAIATASANLQKQATPAAVTPTP